VQDRSARLRRTVSPSPTGVGATDTSRSRCNTKRSADASRGTTITSASAANFRCLLLVQQEVRRAWFKWLRRRSQRTRLKLGEVFGTTQAFPSSASQYPCPNLGRLATSRTDGGAVWWKSPSTDLARARSGRPLLATLQHHFAFTESMSDIGMLYEAACAAAWRPCKRRHRGGAGFHPDLTSSRGISIVSTSR